MSHCLLCFICLSKNCVSIKSKCCFALTKIQTQRETWNVYNGIFSILSHSLSPHWNVYFKSLMFENFSVTLISNHSHNNRINAEEHVQRKKSQKTILLLCYFSSLHPFTWSIYIYIIESSRHHRFKWNMLSNDILCSIKDSCENKTKQKW